MPEVKKGGEGGQSMGYMKGARPKQVYVPSESRTGREKEEEMRRFKQKSRHERGSPPTKKKHEVREMSSFICLLQKIPTTNKDSLKKLGLPVLKGEWSTSE